MNALGAGIPSAWLAVVPVINVWWLWRFCQGVESTTREGLSAAVAFLLTALLGVVGIAIIQDTLNKCRQPAPTIPRVAVI